jgi:DNA-binding transcriptional LysR family regulator
MDLDLRKLRYFATVAELKHFGRAAERLYIAQPVLSRQIRALESELGCALLTRSTRNVQLTAAGERLYEESRAVLATVDSAVRRVHEADRGVERLVVGFMPGLHVSQAVRVFSAEHPNVEIEFVQMHWWEQDAPLRDGRIDVGCLCRPFDESGLRVELLASEQKVACLPVTHPLATQQALSMADLAGESIMSTQSRRTATVEEKFELIAAGGGVALVPESLAATYSRPDISYVPVLDAEPVEICLAVAGDRAQPRVLDFVRAAVAVLGGEREGARARANTGDSARRAV